MGRKKTRMKIERPSTLEILKHTPSELAKQAQLRRNAAGAHMPDVHKRNRQQTRLEEQRAESGDTDDI